MMRAAAALAALGALLLAFSGWAMGQVAATKSLTVAYGTTTTVSVPGATSAYALTPSIVDVSEKDGIVTLRAIGTGSTAVVAVTPDGATTFSVTVPAPPSPASGPAPNAALPGGASEGGELVTGYASGGGGLTNALDFQRRQGDSFERLSVVTQTYVSPSSTTGAQSGTGFPLLSYEAGGPGHDVVYLDKYVNVSPLTFTDALVRGLHVQTGPWLFEGGVSSIAQFGQYLIPSNPQWMGGVTRSFRLDSKSSLAANLYDIVNGKNAAVSTPGGVLGSVTYAYDPQPHLHVLAELGLSRSIGFAAQAQYEDATQTLDASLLQRPPNFASLATDAQQGLFSTLDYTRAASSRLSTNVNVQQSNYDLPAFRDDTLTAQSTTTYALDTSVSLDGGAIYSDYRSIAPAGFGIKTLGIPIGVQYTTKHFNGGLQYQPTTDFSGTLANGYNGNAGITYGAFSAGAYYQHAVDIPTVASVFSDVPGLQAALEQAGIAVNTPAQLAALLNNAALLAQLGFAGLKLDVAPAVDTVGLNASYSLRGASRQQFLLDYTDSNAQLVEGSFAFRLGSLTYLRQLGWRDRLVASAGLLRSTQTGAQGASTTSSPIYSISISHRFTSVPGLLFPSRHGTIGGYVFRDDDASGRYSAGKIGVANAEVTLDGSTVVRTDARGHYDFNDVAYGEHQVAAQLQSSQPFYFTTDSTVSAQIGETVDFGVGFEQDQLFGSVTDDAGGPIAGVTVTLAGDAKHAVTAGDGTFAFHALRPGTYTIAVAAGSVPVGYDLAGLTPQRVDVSAKASAPVTIVVRALRSISGTVDRYDRRTEKERPAPNVRLRIAKLDRTAITDAAGNYTFRDLPAGTFVVEITDGTATQSRSVTLSSDPVTLTGIDFHLAQASP